MSSDTKAEQQNARLLAAHAHVWNYIFNFINSMSLNCAIQLEIPDIIHKHGKPMTLSELIDALPIHPTKTHCVHRLMRILVHSGFFASERISLRCDQEEEEGYVLTDASQLLIKDNPFSVTPYLQAMLQPILLQPWHHVSSWLKSDSSTAFHALHGMPIYEYAAHDLKFNTFFNEAMATDARLVASVLLKDCKGVFDGLSSLVDVGGGTGTLAKAIAKEFPKLECVVLDLPHVVANLEGSENLTFSAGDMFEEIPPANAILLKWILHNWNNEKCVKILKNCKEAVKGKNGGKVIIIDMAMENRKGDYESNETQLLLDMLMMIAHTGQERNEKEWAKLFTDAGFSNYKITPKLGLRSIIEVYP